MYTKQNTALLALKSSGNCFVFYILHYLRDEVIASAVDKYKEYTHFLQILPKLVYAWSVSANKNATITIISAETIISHTRLWIIFTVSGLLLYFCLRVKMRIIQRRFYSKEMSLMQLIQLYVIYYNKGFDSN